MSVRFGERQKFKFAAPSHNIGLTWRAAGAVSGRYWREACRTRLTEHAPAHSLRPNRPWPDLVIISFIVSSRRTANSVTDARRVADPSAIAHFSTQAERKPLVVADTIRNW